LKNYYHFIYRGNKETEAKEKLLTLLSKYNEHTDTTDVFIFVNNGKEIEVVRDIYWDLGRPLTIELYLKGKLYERKKKIKQK